MAAEKKSKKSRKSNYDEKVKIEATFDELMTIIFPPIECKEEPMPKPASKKAKKK